MVFSYAGVDGEEAYPGNLSTKVTYTLNNQNELIFSYLAETDKATPINLTTHTYWNLKGTGSGNILDHELTLNADRYLPTDDDRIPTGEIETVHDMPMDFTRPFKIGARIGEVKGGGYNHCYVLNKEDDSLFSQLSERTTISFNDSQAGRSLQANHRSQIFLLSGFLVFHKILVERFNQNRKGFF